MEQAAGKPKRLKAALLCGTLAAVLAVPSMLAYLTDTDSATNKFTFADSLTVEVVEPSWDTTDSDGNGVPDAAEGVVPTQTLAKDPAITVTGADAYVYIEVKVPLATVSVDGERAYRRPVFEFEADEDNWKFVTTESTSTFASSTDGYMTYFYRYIGGEDGVLADGSTTEPIFETVTMPNIVSNNGESWTAEQSDIVVKGYAIQSEGFAGSEPAWTTYKSQNGL